MKRTTKDWVHKAEDDFQLASQTAVGTPAYHDQVCFHCQQAAEKYLKALLDDLGQTIPKTHDLDLLFNLLLPTYSTLRSLRRALSALSDFAVAVRYPGKRATKRQANACLRWALKARNACRTILGLPTT